MSRKAPAQPKSTRQQYSGARAPLSPVRAPSSLAPLPACGACRMRRVKCDLKDLPTLASGQHPPCSNCSERGLNCVDEFAEVKAVKLLRRGRRLQKVEAVYGKASKEDADLHTLKPEFFRSSFFRRFHIQRPILEPTEYCPRFTEWFNGTSDCLLFPGQLIALVLVVWAASYGLDEGGEEVPEFRGEDFQQRKERVNDMLVELLYLVDIHGLLRKPCWDGVRALLLILPLTEDVQTPMERLVMSDATMSQVYALCSVPSPESVQGDYVDALVRARVFWYAHVTDGITSGLRGGRVILTDDDLSSFEATLPPVGADGGPSTAYSFAYRFATIPIRIASVCRDIHACLTGPKARQREDLDEEGLLESWDVLEKCWRDLEGLRQFSSFGINQPEDIERFIDGWQIFLFESHNVIREALKSRLVALPAQEMSYLPDGQPSPRSRKSEVVYRLHTKANSKCHYAVRHVVNILRKNIGSAFFQYDAALVRDGCFFAGFLLAGESGSREDVEVCITALSEMRWAFSKTEERQRTLRLVWESRAAQARSQSSRSFTSSPSDDTVRGPGVFEGGYVRRGLVRPTSVPPLSLSSTTTMGSGFDGTSDSRWPSTTSGSGSESEQYQPSSRSPSLPSTSSSYATSSHSALSLSSVLHSGDGSAGASPMLITSSRGPSSHQTVSGQSGYFVPPFNYMSIGGEPGMDTRAAAAQSTTLEGLSPVDQTSGAFNHPTPTGPFAYGTVSYSSSNIPQPESGSSYLPPPAAAQGGSPSFGNAASYY
ncbi:uncharacterized protein BXZ73DRAFT_86390 [Epithele typhae]|uniref:uncharacterized protein n=1 Tax=Epithele typhae TaxID=378194 RepID=UPI002008D784|nr:uncharacterized protein BXZ73DRAFT_86390 [Epithele typhae]KAH9946221.1 hypothetical protein BXZ73DRAFT_86390 [Epithele typhae]